MNDISTALSGIKDMLLDREAILAKAIPFPHACIYFLIRGTEIVYIGQSINGVSRVKQHSLDGKDFDSYTYLPCQEHELNILETLYIDKFSPKLNKAKTPNQARYRGGLGPQPRTTPAPKHRLGPLGNA